MSRSAYKGPYVDERVLKKVAGKRPEDIKSAIKTWSRACDIHPDMIGFTFAVHNGRTHTEVFITEDMVGHKLGEFAPTRKFIRHGGKMQKEIDQKKKQAEIDAAKTAKSTADTKKK
jgi:small subunit ribosomal protein S19